MTWVKICGMTNLEDALVAVDAGADAVGFVFYEKSPRCVSVDTAREIVAKLPQDVEKIGVFVDPDSDPMDVLREAGLTGTQSYISRPGSSWSLDSRHRGRTRQQILRSPRVSGIPSCWTQGIRASRVELETPLIGKKCVLWR